MKLSNLSKTSFLLFICFGADKVLAIFRQLIIARQFGLSETLDVFNIANNLPDMLFTLISGGALSMALIPVMADVLTHDGKRAAWKLFSGVANLAFIVSFTLAAFISIFAEPIVTSEVGIAPGFSPEQQRIVVNLMRLNLCATIIFSISGLVMGGLQANQRFLLPALAPIFYNLGQIFGAVFLAPSEPYQIGLVSIPCAGWGVYGLVGGVLIGAAAHLLIQVPGLLCAGFCWTPRISFQDASMRHVIRILGPRVLSVFFVQLIFIIRDNFASRLASGAVTALSYGYMFQQLPETLIGTAIGTAILPTLSVFVSEKNRTAFAETVEKACRIAIGASLGIAVIMGIGLGPSIAFALDFSPEENTLMMWTLRGFLVGLVGHCLLEITNRAFYAQQEALMPLLGTMVNLALYIVLGAILFKPLGAPGISLTDSIAFTVQAGIMLLLLNSRRKQGNFKSGSAFQRFAVWMRGDDTIQGMRMPIAVHIGPTLVRSLIGCIAAAIICTGFIFFFNWEMNNLVKSVLAMLAGLMVYVPFVLPEIKLMKGL